MNSVYDPCSCNSGEKFKFCCYKKRLQLTENQANNQCVTLLTYQVTYEPLKNTEYPPEVITRMNDICELIYSRPQKAVFECLNAIKLYPKIPIFYNYLGGAYQALGDSENLKKYIYEAYTLFPDYIFARCAYAEFKMDSGEVEAIAAIFAQKYCLKALYPLRNVFHIHEVTTFNFTMGRYFTKIGNRETAQIYLKELEHVAPEHTSTQRLRAILNK
ncbi:MAG: hypothetical protein WCT20_04405 [Candidatus Babeliales bacterium]